MGRRFDTDSNRSMINLRPPRAIDGEEQKLPVQDGYKLSDLSNPLPARTRRAFANPRSVVRALLPLAPLRGRGPRHKR